MYIARKCIKDLLGFDLLLMGGYLDCIIHFFCHPRLSWAPLLGESEPLYLDRSRIKSYHILAMYILQLYQGYHFVSLRSVIVLILRTYSC